MGKKCWKRPNQVPGHSAPFHLGELSCIIVLSLKILPVSGKRTLCEGKCNARILVAANGMVTSIHAPPHSVTGLPSHPTLSLGAPRAEPLTQDGDPTPDLPRHPYRFKNGTQFQGGQRRLVRLSSHQDFKLSGK